MRELIALDLAGGPRFVEALQRAWDDGDAVTPLDQRLPADAARAVVERLGVCAVVTEHGRHAVDGGRPVEDGDALVMATSGSTGAPKGVVLTHRAVQASATATSEALGVTTDDHWLACLPLNHVGGLSVITRALHSGTALTVLDRFDPDAVMRSSATLVSLVATALHRIDAGHFRTIVLGGSRPPDDRPANTVTTYGLTETGSGVIYDGRPLRGVGVRIVEGEIQLRGDMLLRCYRGQTASAFTRDGWFATGDLGAIDAGGLVTVSGRGDDLIITGGENVWPEMVEAVLRDLPEIADVAVAGMADPEWGQVVTAHIVWTDAASTIGIDVLRALVRETLPAFAAPRAIVTHRRLPRTSLGKLQRKLLAAQTGVE